MAAYGELEAAQLAADLKAALPQPPQGSPGQPGGEETEAAVHRLAGSIKPAFEALHGAVERWGSGQGMHGLQRHTEHLRS